MYSPRNAATLAAGLQQFSGTEIWYRHELYRQFLYTDGIKYLVTEGECHWLTDRIFGLQYEEPSLKREAFQTWSLKVSAEQTALLQCEDGNCNPVYSEIIPYTDFPLSEIKLFFTGNVLLLPSEY